MFISSRMAECIRLRFYDSVAAIDLHGPIATQIISGSCRQGRAQNRPIIMTHILVLMLDPIDTVISIIGDDHPVLALARPFDAN